MNPTRLLIFVAVLLVLIALALWQLTDGTAADVPESPVDPATRPLIAGDPEQLRSFTVFHDEFGRRMRIERTGDERFPWRMTEPLRDRTEPVVVWTALNHLFGGNWKEAGSGWASREAAALGLDPARLVVECEFADGDTQVLRIGAPTLEGDSLAAERNGERILVAGALGSYFERPPTDWRDRRLIPDPQRVRRLRWAPRDGAGFTLERQGTGWRLVEPIDAPLSQQAEAALNTLLGSRLGAIADDFYTEAQAAEMRTGDELRLESPEGEQVLRFKELAALDEGRPYLLGVDVESLAFLRRPLDEIRSPRLLTLRPDEIATAWVRQGGTEVRFQRARVGDRTGWKGPDGLLPAGKTGALDFLVEFACTVERGESVPLPEGEPLGWIRLSRSHGDTLRGTETLRWWRAAGEKYAAASANMETAVLVGQNLEFGVGDLLKGY